MDICSVVGAAKVDPLVRRSKITYRSVLIVRRRLMMARYLDDVVLKKAHDELHLIQRGDLGQKRCTSIEIGTMEIMFAGCLNVNRPGDPERESNSVARERSCGVYFLDMSFVLIGWNL